MEVKPGYKPTEVGVIPEEWDLTPLVELIDASRSIRYGIVQPGKFDPSGRYMVRGQDYSTGWVDPSELFRVTPQVEEPFKNARVKAGDVIITIVGASTGHIEVIPDWLDGANLTQTTARLAINPSKAFSGFCKYYLQSSAGQRQVASYLKGAAQPGLNCGDIEKFKIPLPPSLPEQRAIATALSDVDGLLGGLDRLIAKKRDLKQAAMQQLLTGQTRLPGFHGEWEAATIGDVCSFSGGSQPPRSTFRFVPTPGYVRLIQIRDYKSDDFACYIPEALARKRCNSEDIMIGRYGPPIFQILRGIEGAYNVALIKTTLSPKVERNFFFNVLKQEPLFQFIELLSRRSSGQTGVEISALKAYGLPLPPLPEQTAIAEVLSEMDGELAVLEQRREKTRALKQAMMQELLTGRTRLV